MLQTAIASLAIIVAVVYLIRSVFRGKCHKGCSSCPLHNNCKKEERRTRNDERMLKKF